MLKRDFLKDILIIITIHLNINSHSFRIAIILKHYTFHYSENHSAEQSVSSLTNHETPQRKSVRLQSIVCKQNLEVTKEEQEKATSSEKEVISSLPNIHVDRVESLLPKTANFTTQSYNTLRAREQRLRRQLITNDKQMTSIICDYEKKNKRKR